MQQEQAVRLSCCTWNAIGFGRRVPAFEIFMVFGTNKIVVSPSIAGSSSSEQSGSERTLG